MDNWANNYIDLVNSREETEITNRKTKWAKELNTVSKQLRRKFGRYNKEAKYIDKRIIPYVMRMAYYPDSYMRMIAGYEELLKYGRRQNRRIW